MTYTCIATHLEVDAMKQLTRFVVGVIFFCVWLQRDSDGQFGQVLC